MASLIGLNGSGQSDTPAATLTFSTTQQIEIGHHVVVCEGDAGGGDHPSGVTVGSLALTERIFDTSTRDFSIWSAAATGTITAGSTVTITFPVSPSTRYGACLTLEGVDTVSPVAGSDVNTFGSVTSYNAGPTASVAVGCVMVACVHVSLNQAISPVAPYTELLELGSAAIGTSWQVETLSFGQGGPQTAAWTTTPATTAAAGVVAFQSVKTTPPFSPDRMPLGV